MGAAAAAFELPRTVVRRLPAETWERVDPDVLTALGDEIASLSARLNAGTYRLLALIAEFDRLEGWKREGFSSCVAWLAYRTRLDKMTAREKVRIARALAALPKTSEAMARGELSFSQVRAITRAADPESEEELLEHARTMSAAQLEKLVRSWKKLPREDETRLEARIHASRTLSIFPDDEGAYLIRGRLEPQVAALLMRAIEAASDALYNGSVPETTPEQRRADALAFLVERALEDGFEEGAAAAENACDDGTVGSSNAANADEPKNGSDGDVAAGAPDLQGVSAEAPTDPVGLVAEGGDSPATPTTPGRIRLPASERYTVIVHMEEDGSAYLEDGTRVSAETARRIACDASVVRVRVSKDGGWRELEGKRRSIPPRLRRALQIRDQGCRFPGCGSRFAQAHHIEHWADGGPTRLSNLVSLCAQHHRLMHEGGFRVRMDPTRPDQPVFHSPSGFAIPDVPPRMTVDGRALGIGSRVPRWEGDVPLSFYLRALNALS